MVLHKNKWDHKAKIAYLKKHGLTRPKPQPQITPKWSSKKTSDTKRAIYLDDSDDSDWDSEDEALINHFYPEIAEQDISVEQKVKIKRQIITALRQKEADAQNDGEDADEDNQEAGESEDEIGGIYLGTEPEEPIELPDLDSRLSDFVITDVAKPSRNRKLLKSKVSDTLLEDYGISSYKDTVKDSNYNDVRKQTFDFDSMTGDDLHGFRIGQQETSTTPSIRTLTEEERQEHTERSKKLESAKLYEQMKKKFGESQARAKVLEINNFNASDGRLMDVLNKKLTQSADKTHLDDDLDFLLGEQAVGDKHPAVSGDLDLLLQQATAAAPIVETKKHETKAPAVSKLDEGFLDDLLG